MYGGNEYGSIPYGGDGGPYRLPTDIDSEITGIARIPTGRFYRILVKDGDGNFIGEFDRFRNLRFGKRLNDYGTASFEIPATDLKAGSLVSLRQYTVWIYYEKDNESTLVWAGEQALREGRLDNEGNNWCTINCYDWLEQLKDRYTRPLRRYTQVDAGQIAWDLIDKTQQDYQDLNTGLVLPGTVTNDTSIGTEAWVNVNNIKTDDTDQSGNEPTSTDPITNYLKATNFGLSVPTGATVLGVKATIKADSEDVTDTNYVYSSSVRLVKAGVIGDTNLGNETHWADDTADASDKVLEYGGENELWNETLTPSDVNNSGFGIALSATAVTETSIQCGVFYIKVTVYYENPSGSDNGDFGITEGTIEVTVDRDRTYYNQNVMEAIINLSNVISGFDFEITNDKVFNVQTVIGRDLTESVILEYGHNIESVQIVEDFVHPVNRAIVLGQSSDDLNNLVRVTRNDTDSQDDFKIREGVLSEMDVSETTTMEDKGDAMLRKYGTPLFKIDLNMASVMTPNITQIASGDDITLIIQSGIYNIRSDYRIFEWAVEYDDNNVEKLTLILGSFTYE